MALLPNLWQWLGLGALVVLAHAWVLSGSWEFAADAPALSAGGFQTRSVAAVAPPQTAPATRQAPVAKKAVPKPKPKTITKPQPAPTQSIATEPPSTANLEQNQPIAGENTAQAATNSVASTQTQSTDLPGADSAQVPSQTQVSSPPNGQPAYVLGPVAVPAPQNLNYTVQALRDGRQYHASGELLWQHDGQRYEARLQASVLWFGREFSSVGQMGAWGLEPSRYGDKTNRRERAAHFQRDSGQISFSNNRPGTELQSGGQDMVSSIVQVASLFAGAADKYPPGSTISLQVARASEAGLWSFEVQGPENLTLPQGPTSTLKLLRSPRAGREFDDQLELWLMPERAYMPARIKLTQANGDMMDMVLR
jgi:Protein of unknown function (DUF3108)